MRLSIDSKAKWTIVRALICCFLVPAAYLFGMALQRTGQLSLPWWSGWLYGALTVPQGWLLWRNIVWMQRHGRTVRSFGVRLALMLWAALWGAIGSTLAGNIAIFDHAPWWLTGELCVVAGICSIVLMRRLLGWRPK